jgi:hypothetical protein
MASRVHRFSPYSGDAGFITDGLYPANAHMHWPEGSMMISL